MKDIATNSTSAALVSVLFALPFVVMNSIVGDRIEPFFSLIRPDSHTSVVEYVLLAVILLLLPVGAFVAIRPMFKKGANGERTFHLLNIAVAALLLAGFIALSAGFGSDVYRCDVLRIPNCD